MRERRRDGLEFLKNEIGGRLDACFVRGAVREACSLPWHAPPTTQKESRKPAEVLEQSSKRVAAARRGVCDADFF